MSGQRPTDDDRFDGPSVGQNLTPPSTVPQLLEGPLRTPEPQIEEEPSLEFIPDDSELPDTTLKPPSAFNLLFPVPSVIVTTVDQALLQQVWPTATKIAEEIARGFRITRDQLSEILQREIQSGIEVALEEGLEAGHPSIRVVDEDFAESEIGEKEEDVLRRKVQEIEGLNQALRERTEAEIGAPAELAGGQVIRNLTRIGLYTPLVLATRGLGGGPVTTVLLGGTLASMAAFETDEPRVTDLLVQLDNPAFNNIYTQALKSDPTDPFWKAKLKQGIEDLVIGAATLGTLKVGGTVVRKTIDQAQELYSSALSMMRKRTSSAVGVTEDTVGFQTSFRREVEAADIEVARIADDLLRRPLPEGVSEDAYKASLLQSLRKQIGEISNTHSKKVEGILVKPFTRRDVDAKIDLFSRRFDKADIPPLRDNARARQIKEALNANDAAVEEASKRTLASTASAVNRSMRENVVDRSGTVKRELLEAGGDEGKRAVRLQELALGASHAAQRVYDQAYRRIFQDVPRGDRKALADLIRLRRIREIKSYNPEWEPPVVGKSVPKSEFTLEGSIGESTMLGFTKSGSFSIVREGKEVGKLVVNLTENTKVLSIENIAVEGGTGKLGTTAVRDLLKQLSALFPEAKAVAGLRIGGIRSLARTDIADPTRIPIIKLPKQPPGKLTRTTVEDYDALVDDLRRQVGEVKYTGLSRSADSYFNEMAKALDVLQETGVISGKEYARLWRFQWSPIRFLKEMDPSVATLREGRNVISVSSSGIKPLARGHRRLMMNDPELFLGEVIGRAYGRAFRNKANVGLYNVARSQPDNPVVRLKRPKAGKDQWSELSVFVDGEKKSMFLRKDLMLGWSVDPVGVPMWASMLAGATFVRPFATGSFAPQFALVNFAYDVPFAMSTAGAGRLYSPFYPIAGLQIGRDLVETAADTFMRKGLFDQFVDRGGMMSLLTHQGRITTAAPGKLLSPTMQALRSFEHYAGFVNESTEVWVRLSIMNRALRRTRSTKGFTTSEDIDDAVWEARRYLDFGQGGSIAKKVDGIIPYTNAALQGFRGAARAVKESPGRMAIRAAQVAGISSSMWWANHIVNPEAWADVPSYVKDSHLVFTTPFWRTDREGNRRYIYFKIPLEHTLRPIHALMNATMQRVYTGEAPRDTTLNVIRTGAQIFPGIGGMPPSVNAMMALAGNFDFWRGEQIWRGPKNMPPEMERNISGEKPTSQLAIDVSEGVNPLLDDLGASAIRLSPARLEVASRAIVPVSPWTELIGYSYTLAREGLDESLREAHYLSMQEGLTNTPIIKRFIGETHPFIGDVEKLRRQQERTGAEAFRFTEEINKQIDNFRKQGEFGVRQAKVIGKWIEQAIPQVHQTRLVRHLKDQVKMQAVFDRFNPDEIPGSMSRSWWRVLSTDRPTTRAAGFFDMWQNVQLSIESPDTETRELAQRHRRLILQLMRNVPGFDPRRSREFGMELQRLSRASGIKLP